ncbi:CU044_5270 family protein [Nonomuraea sp. NPDC000554]|uniref:CU044_5270 family protein n=1 Tax=Nonomuraea sp. NPDC000554 TaxID=3154259 RepID=UPI003317C07C
MDELKLLSEMRADAPEPDAERLRSLRARAPKRRRRFWLAPSLLAAATAATAVAVAMSGPQSHAVRPTVTAEPRPVSAETVLLRAAQAAERRQTPETPRPDQWIYRKVAVKEADGSAARVQEVWLRYDGTREAVRVGDGRLETRKLAPGLSPSRFAAKLAQLPTDPGELLAQVKSDPYWATRSAERPDERAYRALAIYLDHDVPVPPKLQGAMYRALAQIPGVRVDSGVQDVSGRTGIGLAYESGSAGTFGTDRDSAGQVISRTYLILDPTTYQLLGMRVDYLKDKIVRDRVAFRAGTTYATANLAAGVVDRPGDVPR